MKSINFKKYALFFFLVAVLVGIDQWTKQISEERLATQRPGAFSHTMLLEVDAANAGKTVEEFLREELRFNSDEEITQIAERYAVTPSGDRLRPHTELAAGDEVEILRREIVVIDGYWDFQYTRNPGAAFGILADADESFREPFFRVVSVIALLLILVLLQQTKMGQRILFSGLTFVAAGAVGNFVDRIRFGYVIDFVVWKYTDEYRWPTFNVADVLICIGFALIVIEMIRDGLRERAEKKLASEAGGSE